jgi:hypothetical protein
MRRPLRLAAAGLGTLGVALAAAVASGAPVDGPSTAAHGAQGRTPAPSTAVQRAHGRAAVAATVAHGPRRRTAAPGRLLVTATEFRLALSRPSVAAGVVVVELLVAGEDVHDLRLQRLDARGRPTGRVLGIPRVAPGEVGDGEFRLTRGRWRLTCTVADHARMGMVATLRVR